MAPLLGLVWALAFAVPVSLLSWLRVRLPERRPFGIVRKIRKPPAPVRPVGGAHGAKPTRRPASPPPRVSLRVVLIRLMVSVAVLFLVDTLAFYLGRPMKTFPGLLPLIAVNLLVVLVTAAAGRPRSLVNGGNAAALTALAVLAVIWLVGHNRDHDAYAASHLVSVTVEPNDELPASSTDNMVVVSPDIATTKASQAMATGLAGQRNYSTYLQLGPATLQYVAGHMWYVYPLEFDGSGNKARLHAIMPGYIMVSAEDPNAAPVEHYDGAYSMIVGLGGGQGSEPDRWAYDHGYSGYLLDDPTLEINDQGLPYYTVTLLRPRLGWTFMAPVGVLVINAHTGQITRYPVGAAPDWVDRVYSQDTAEQIANWYGEYAQAGFRGFLGIGSTDANRLRVSGAPIMVYTGTGHPVWRMLLTSYNSDTSVSRIVEMNSATGALQVYAPQGPMGVEGPVTQAFDNASGIGASLVKADHYNAVDLNLLVLYGHLTWMAIYEPDSSNPSFTGVGFVDAYQATASNVVFGNSKEAALGNYLTQLASEGNGNGAAPEQGGQYQTFTGKIAAIGWDITGGQKYWYITLAGDKYHVYVGTVASVGPALVLAQPGDPVTITVLDVGTQESTRTMQSFTDVRVPLQAPGS
jgi:hypothetical protein